MSKVYTSPGVYVEEVPPLARPIAGVGTSTPGFIGVVPDKVHLPAPTPTGFKWVDFTLPAGAAVGKAPKITSWTQFTKLFGDFTGDPTANATADNNPALDAGQNTLAHAVFGFFDNGGTSCYVTRVAPGQGTPDLSGALRTLDTIDDISTYAAPGQTDATNYAALVSHCTNLQDRVAILDSVQEDANKDFSSGTFSPLATPVGATDGSTGHPGLRPVNSDYSAFYFPWIQVFDPTTNLTTPSSKGLVYVPPSGHIAGIWARSDAASGVDKAPANEPVSGAVDLRWHLTKADQDGLNPKGVNLIRFLNGNNYVWGARTVGGDDNGNFKYISTRRFFNFVRKSLEQGTQWVVFEPNNPSLWARIIRSASDFLLEQWRAGALFGDTPKQAFYVKCDAETNPPDTIALGQVITEIGVAIVQPAEFVIFRIQQEASGG